MEKHAMIELMVKIQFRLDETEKCVYNRTFSKLSKTLIWSKP